LTLAGWRGTILAKLEKARRHAGRAGVRRAVSRRGRAPQAPPRDRELERLDWEARSMSASRHEPPNASAAATMRAAPASAREEAINDLKKAGVKI
jgi:hypothetical protein